MALRTLRHCSWSKAGCRIRQPGSQRISCAPHPHQVLRCVHARVQPQGPWQDVAELKSDKSLQDMLSEGQQEAVAELMGVDRTAELLLWLWDSMFNRRKPEASVTKLQPAPALEAELVHSTHILGPGPEQPVVETPLDAPPHQLIAPPLPTAADPSTGDVCILGGGCFWCMDAVFRQVAGVKHVTCGYSGGRVPAPTYQAVAAGHTGHAEVVRVEYDPKVVSFRALLEIYLATLQQGEAEGGEAAVGSSQYRPLIVCTTSEQIYVAHQMLQKTSGARVPELIDAGAVPESIFWPAEPEHQGMFMHQPASQYSLQVVRPRLAWLRSEFGGLLKPAALQLVEV